jgi:hypothetical protein
MYPVEQEQRKGLNRPDEEKLNQFTIGKEFRSAYGKNNDALNKLYEEHGD